MTQTTSRKTMTAKYDGFCKGCNSAIAKGQQITHERTAGSMWARTRHLECDAKPAMPSTPKTYAARPTVAHTPVAAGPCRSCGSYCYGDCTASARF